MTVDLLMVNMRSFNDAIYTFRYSKYQSNFHTDTDVKSQSGIKLNAQSSLYQMVEISLK